MDKGEFFYLYRLHTEYDGKVMFSVCLFTGGHPRGTPPTRGAPPGGTPINLDKNVGQKMDNKLDKHFGNFWRWGGGGVGGTPLVVMQEDCLVRTCDQTSR